MIMQSAAASGTAPACGQPCRALLASPGIPTGGTDPGRRQRR